MRIFLGSLNGVRQAMGSPLEARSVVEVGNAGSVRYTGGCQAAEYSAARRFVASRLVYDTRVRWPCVDFRGVRGLPSVVRSASSRLLVVLRTHCACAGGKAVALQDSNVEERQKDVQLGRVYAFFHKQLSPNPFFRRNFRPMTQAMTRCKSIRVVWSPGRRQLRAPGDCRSSAAIAGPG